MKQPYSMVLNSQRGPHELSIRHREDGTVELHFPHTTPDDVIIIPRGGSIRMSVQVFGPAVPVEMQAWLVAAAGACT